MIPFQPHRRGGGSHCLFINPFNKSLLMAASSVAYCKGTSGECPKLTMPSVLVDPVNGLLRRSLRGRSLVKSSGCLPGSGTQWVMQSPKTATRCYVPSAEAENKSLELGPVPTISPVIDVINPQYPTSVKSGVSGGVNWSSPGN